MTPRATTCYMCSTLATSLEHVPPKGLFPKIGDLPPRFNLRKQLITVPSCDAHNSEKTLDDEYLMYILVLGIQNSVTAQRQVHTKITRALTKSPAVGKLITQTVQAVHVEDTTTGKVEGTFALQVNAERVHKALDHIGRALHFRHLNAKWTGSIQVIPLFLLSLNGDAPQQFNTDLDSMGSWLRNSC